MWVWAGGYTGGDVGIVIIVDACCMGGEGLVDCRFFGVFSYGPLPC